MKSPSRLSRALRFALGMLAAYVGVVVAVSALVVLTQNHDYRHRIDELAAGYLQTEGTITSFEAHGGVCYTYVVAAVRYSDCSTDDYREGQVVGDAIPVNYGSTDPSLSCACDVQSERGYLAYGWIPFALVVGFVGPLFFPALRKWWIDTAPAQSNPGGR